MKKIIILLMNIGFLTCSVSVLIASTGTGSVDEIISLKEFIETVTKKDKVFEEILIDELFLKYKKDLNLPIKDLILSVKSQFNVLINPTDNEIENSISLNKLFPFKGTELEAKYNSTLNSTSREIGSKFTLLVSQPIAENAFGRGTKLKDKIIGLEIDLIKFQISEAYEDYLAELIKIYYNWYSAYESLKTGKNSYEKNLKLLENVKEREKSKIALPIDVNKINLQVLGRKESLIKLESSFNVYLNLVKNALRYEGDKNLIPSYSLLFDEKFLEFKKEYENFRNKSRTTEILLMLEEKSLIELDKYADELLPSINLYGGYSIEGDGHGIDNSGQSVFLGVSLEFPFARPGKLETANYETSKINLKNIQLSSKNIHVKLYTKLKNLYYEIQSENDLINIFEKKIKLAEAIVEDETKNYSLGKVSLKDLIDEVNKLENNKFNKISHEIQLKKLIIDWLRLTDNLIVEGQIKK